MRIKSTFPVSFLYVEAATYYLFPCKYVHLIVAIFVLILFHNNK